MSYKAHFQRFLSAAPERLHFAAHSHHFWPDVSYDAQLRAWEDAARFADRKWDVVFGELAPRARGHVARRLGLEDGNGVAFAPNTHELVLRILSCLPSGRVPRVLTTTSEFHSFTRQTTRLEEAGELALERVPVEPFASFPERFSEAAANGGHDLVFLSHVFFDSGWAVPDLAGIVRTVKSRDSLVVIDGYHAFMALPVELGALSSRVFYLGGGYKYAMSGEGCCFVHAPPGYGERPKNTGWYASFGALAGAQGGPVGYAEGGARFLGATFDPTALYRFDAVMRWLDELGVTPATIHAHALGLQELFVAELRRTKLPFSEAELVVPLSTPNRGQFLTFRTPRAAEIQARLAEAQLVCDVRGDRLRFGFGLYHDPEDVVRGVARMAATLGG